MRIFTLPDSFLGRAHFRLSEDRLRAPLMSHPKGAVPLGTLGTIGRELKSWGSARQTSVLDNQAWECRGGEVPAGGLWSAGSTCCWPQFPSKATWRDWVRKALEGGSFAFWASTRLALKAEGRTPLVLPKGNQKL